MPSFLNMTVEPVALTGWATFAMAVVTFCLVIITVISTLWTHSHNKKTLELMKKAYEPTLSLDLCRETSYEAPGQQFWIIIRNDGNGSATKVELYYRFYIGKFKSGETSRVESEKDLAQGGPAVQIGSMAPGMERKRALFIPAIDAYAVHLEVRYDDVFDKRRKSSVKVFFEDVWGCNISF